MSNTYTGTGGASGLEVRTIDLATDLFGIDIIEVSNGTLTVGASPNIARITTGGGGGGGGVTNIAFGTTGLTPAALTSGNVTVAGTLVAANGGTSFNTYATGDVIYASAANTLAKLAAGADGEVLTLAAGVPSWAASTGGIGGTIAAGQVAFGTAADTIGGSGNLIWNNTGGSERLTITSGSAGECLRIVSTAAAASAPDMSLVRDATYSAGLDLGVILFKGENDAAAEFTYAYIVADAKDGTAGSEKGQLDFRIRGTNDTAAGNTYPLRLNDTGAIFNTTGTAEMDVRWNSGTVTNAMLLNAGADTANFGVKTFVTQSTALTNTATYPVRITHETSGTPAVGLGVGLEFESEAPAQAGTNYVGSIIESVSTAGTTAGNTRYDLVLKNYNGAAASEVARFTSTGGFNTTTSIAGGTTVGIDPGAGGTVTVGGTGGVTTTNGPITAVGAAGAISAATTVTGGTGVTATTGNVSATVGAVSAGTTVTGGTGVIATTGNVAATAGAVTAGTSVSATTTVSAGGTVTGGTGLIATTGDCEVTDGNVSVGGDGSGASGNVSARVGFSSQIAGQIYGSPIAGGANLALVSANGYGAVTELLADTYVLGPYGVPEEVPAAGATATFLCLNANVTVSVDGVEVTSVAGGGASGTSFTCPQFESFTIYCTAPDRFFVFGNVTVL